MKRLPGIAFVNLALLVLAVGISSSSTQAQNNCLPVSIPEPVGRKS